MTTPAQSTLDGLLDLIYPPKCLGCRTLNPHHICASCLLEIEPVPRPYCPRCGHPILHQCWRCRGRIRSFTTARAAGDYSGILREAIHAFKYGGARMLADPLAHVLYRYLNTRADFPWRRTNCIVPVPIHPARQRVRGYNQSELLAERLCEMTGLPLLSNVLVRGQHTRPQVELSGDERREERQSCIPGGRAVSGERKDRAARGRRCHDLQHDSRVQPGSPLGRRLQGVRRLPGVWSLTPHDYPSYT